MNVEDEQRERRQNQWSEVRGIWRWLVETPRRLKVILKRPLKRFASSELQGAATRSEFPATAKFISEFPCMLKLIRATEQVVDGSESRKCVIA